MKKDKFDSIILKQILDYLSINKKKMGIAVGCLFVTTVASFLQPLIVKRITDDGLINRELNIIASCVFVLISVVIVNKVSDLIMAELFADIHNEAEYHVFDKAFEKLMKLKYEYFIDKNESEIINNLFTDINAVTALTDRNNIMFISYAFQVLSGIVGLLMISPILTVAVLLLIPLKYISVSKLSKTRKLKMKEYLKEMSSFSAWISEIVSGIKEIKLWNLYLTEKKEFDFIQKKLLDKKKAFTMIDAWNTFFGTLFEWLIVGGLYILGGFLLIHNRLSLGGMFAFISYSSFVTGPIAAILNVKMLLAQMIPSAKRFLEFMELEEEEEGKDSEIEPGELVFENVVFSYEKERDILKDVSISIPLGAKVAIIGPNGSGKTTLLNLLLRFLRPDKGRITISGKDVQEIRLEEYRKLFSVVSQKPYVFNKSIKDNIDLEKKAEESKLNYVYQRSGVNQLLQKLSKREYMVIGNNGAKLSGGEKQKLAVARALLRDTPYIILDEATSGFDVSSDRYLHEMIINELKEKTIILVTHRYTNLEGMDRIYQIEKGKALRIK